MRFDAQIEVICDQCGCQEYWSPSFVYRSILGDGGHYDTSDAAFAKWINAERWSQEGGKDFCVGCTERRTAIAEGRT